MIAICVCAYLYTYWQQNRPNDFWSHLKTSNTADRLVDKDEQIIIDHVNCFERNEHEFLMRLLITKKNRPSQAIDLTTDINICDQRLRWHVNHFIYIWCKNFVCWFFKIIFSSYGDSVNFKKKKDCVQNWFTICHIGLESKQLYNVQKKNVVTCVNELMNIFIE